MYDGHTGMCTIYYRLRSVCVQVGLNDESEWKLNSMLPNANSFGCTPDDNWSAVEYIHLTNSNNGNIYNLQFDDISVKIRHKSDPYFLMESLTNGSGNKIDFGFSAKEASTLGIILILVGLLLGVNPGLVCYSGLCGGKGDADERSNYRYENVVDGGDVEVYMDDFDDEDDDEEEGIELT